jgi:dTDP-4-amino-4,6-dideoxygalactose transaminase
MNRIKFADPAGDFLELKREIDAAVREGLATGDYIRGKAVDEFEKEFAAFLRARHAVGVASGTDALLLSLLALGIGKGDEVVTPANTFIATAFAIELAGATPVLVDASEDTLNIDCDLVEQAITKKTKAIMPVHLFGQPADMDVIMRMAKKHKLAVIEDACQAHGAQFKGKKVGTFGELSAFSFYPTKNLGAAGDGGAVVTDSERLAEKVRALGNYGSIEKNIHAFSGRNSRLDTLQARILLIKLKRLAAWNKKRQKIAAVYDKFFNGCKKIRLTKIGAGRDSVYHLYVIRVKDRDKVVKQLAKTGIPAMVHYPVPIHLQPAFKYLGYKRGDFPIAENAAKTMISLPMHPRMEPGQAEFVAGQVLAAMGEK